MEFREFVNPESADYDVYSSLVNTQYSNIDNPYDEQLAGLIGVLEDVSEKELLEKYGITYDEYLHPTEATIDKVMDAIQMEKGFSKGKVLWKKQLVLFLG